MLRTSSTVTTQTLKALSFHVRNIRPGLTACKDPKPRAKNEAGPKIQIVLYCTVLYCSVLYCTVLYACDFSCLCGRALVEPSANNISAGPQDGCQVLTVSQSNKKESSTVLYCKETAVSAAPRSSTEVVDCVPPGRFSLTVHESMSWKWPSECMYCNAQSLEGTPSHLLYTTTFTSTVVLCCLYCALQQLQKLLHQVPYLFLSKTQK